MLEVGMKLEMRRERRRPLSASYSLRWRGPGQDSNVIEVQGIDISSGGVKVRCATEIASGSSVFIEGKTGRPSGRCTVTYCNRRDSGYEIGLEFAEETRATLPALTDEGVDYYEFLQISPKAETATIYRIYRFMASRFHPDNPETGDPEKFLLLQRAFEVLSNADTRAEYDAIYENRETEALPIFELSQFVNGIDGEMNRRLGVLALLYNKRRTNPSDPTISLRELEKQMSFPREYLDFTTWYLKSKQYITVADNSDFALTALGVDYIESNTQDNPMLTNLLESTAQTATGPSARRRSRTSRHNPELFHMNCVTGELPPVSLSGNDKFASPMPDSRRIASGD
jgi:curved DNA-binding protein CbpA